MGDSRSSHKCPIRPETNRHQAQYFSIKQNFRTVVSHFYAVRCDREGGTSRKYEISQVPKWDTWKLDSQASSSSYLCRHDMKESGKINHTAVIERRKPDHSVRRAGMAIEWRGEERDRHKSTITKRKQTKGNFYTKIRDHSRIRELFPKMLTDTATDSAGHRQSLMQQRWGITKETKWRERERGQSC